MLSEQCPSQAQALQIALLTPQLTNVQALLDKQARFLRRVHSNSTSRCSRTSRPSACPPPPPASANTQLSTPHTTLQRYQLTACPPRALRTTPNFMLTTLLIQRRKRSDRHTWEASRWGSPSVAQWSPMKPRANYGALLSASKTKVSQGELPNRLSAGARAVPARQAPRAPPRACPPPATLH